MIGQLEALVRLHPLREGLWHTLITALYRNGRQADALAAYARVRDILVEELGIDPGRELQALKASVLQADPLVRGGLGASSAARRQSAQALVTAHRPHLGS